MSAMTRMTFDDLDLSVIDPHERDTRYIYDEIFEQKIYAHPNFRVPAGATIVDVGGNIGLFSIWAARTYRPATIYSYEASPATYRYLADNVARHVDPAVTTAQTINRAVSNRAGMELVLHQAPFISGLSTLLAPGSIPWLGNLERSGELDAHKTITTTLSDEFAKNAIDRVGMLKIDVEGHFMEVLGGIAPADWAKIDNVVLETDYLEVLGLTEADVCESLSKKGFATEARDLTVYAWRKS